MRGIVLAAGAPAAALTVSAVVCSWAPDPLYGQIRGRMVHSVDLSRTFVHLSNSGDLEQVELTPSFWRDSSSRALYDRLVGTFDFNSSEDLHSAMQEMHPEADELIFVVSGAIDVILQEGDSEQAIPVVAGEAAIVPRGVWHRLVMRKPGKLLFVNSRTGMQSRET